MAYSMYLVSVHSSAHAQESTPVPSNLVASRHSSGRGTVCVLRNCLLQSLSMSQRSLRPVFDLAFNPIDIKHRLTTIPIYVVAHKDDSEFVLVSGEVGRFHPCQAMGASSITLEKNNPGNVSNDIGSRRRGSHDL